MTAAVPVRHQAPVVPALAAVDPAAVRVRAAAPIHPHPAAADQVRVPARAAVPAHQIHLRRPAVPRLRSRRLAAVQSALAVVRPAVARRVQAVHPIVHRAALQTVRVLPRHRAPARAALLRRRRAVIHRRAAASRVRVPPVVHHRLVRKVNHRSHHRIIHRA